MITGIIDHSFHTRDIEKLRGIKRYMPLSFILSIIAGFSMAGIPPLSGFYSKEYFLTVVYGLTQSNMLYMVVVIAVVIGALGTAIYSLILAFKPFLGKFDNSIMGTKKLHLPSNGIFISPIILVVFVIINTFIKDYIVIPAQQAALAVKTTNNEVISHVHHDSFFSSELLTSIVVIIASFAIYKLYASRNGIYSINPTIISIHGAYNNLGNLLHKVSGTLHDTFVTNQLRRNMSYIFVVLSATIIGGYFAIGRPIILSSGIGFMMTALYVTFRAPDLAMTQFVIESISTIIFLIAFILLTDKTKQVEKQSFKLTNAIIATLTGISFIIVGLVSYAYKNPSEISQFYFDNVVASGGGNIVNVIIVDFRGFDTLFEITVMTMVALIIYAMFKIIKRGGPKDEN